jgi:anti-sigma factor RsiW
MTRPVDDVQLMAYLDGELTEAESLAVEQALAASSELREREAELRQLLGDLVFDFAQLDALDALALTRYAEGNALPPRNEPTADNEQLRGSQTRSSGSPEPLSFALHTSRESERSTTAVTRSWSRPMGWLAAAALLLAVGAGTGWWFAQSDRSGAAPLVASDGVGGVGSSERTPAPAERRVASQPRSPQASETRAATSGSASSAEGSRTTPSTREVAVATPSEASGDSSMLNSPLTGSAPTVTAPMSPTISPPSAIRHGVAIRIANNESVGGTNSPAGESGGVRNFVIDGVRVAVAFGTEVPESLATLEEAGLPFLTGQSALGRAPVTIGAQALRGGTIAAGARRDSLCPSGLRFTDPETGLALSVRGPASCARLASLALQVKVQQRP